MPFVLFGDGNTTNGSWWMLSDPLYYSYLPREGIPPTVVGGSFRSDLKNPPTAVGGISLMRRPEDVDRISKVSTNYRWWDFQKGLTPVLSDAIMSAAVSLTRKKIECHKIVDLLIATLIASNAFSNGATKPIKPPGGSGAPKSDGKGMKTREEQDRPGTKHQLHVEAEVNHVPFLHDVVFSFEPE